MQEDDEQECCPEGKTQDLCSTPIPKEKRRSAFLLELVLFVHTDSDSSPDA